MQTKRLVFHSGELALQSLRVKHREFAATPRFEIAPGQFLGAVVTEDDGARAFTGFRWGISPPWWDDSHAGHRLFSARAENLANRPAWAEALRFRRAVVPVDGVWVWSRAGVECEAPRPFYVRLKNGEPMFLAALWQEGESGRELALVSVEANRLLEPFGARMPAILRGDDAQVWLERGVVDPKTLTRALKTPPARELLVTPTDSSAKGRASLEAASDAREALAEIYGARFQADKPKFEPRKRLVRRDHEAGGHVFFRTRSFTRDDATRWHPVVDVETGRVFCDCPDFHYRHDFHDPDVWTPQWWCKHVRRAVENCRRHRELPERETVA